MIEITSGSGGIADVNEGASLTDNDVNDPNVWSGRAVQEVSSILAMRSCINVSGL